MMLKQVVMLKKRRSRVSVMASSKHNIIIGKAIILLMYALPER